MAEPKYFIENDTLIIKVDVSKEAVAAAPLSNSQKNRLVASSHGNKTFQLLDGRTVTLGFNVMADKS